MNFEFSNSEFSNIDRVCVRDCSGNPFLNEVKKRLERKARPKATPRKQCSILEIALFYGRVIDRLFYSFELLCFLF